MFTPRTLFVDGKFLHLAGQLDCFKVEASSANKHVGDIERFVCTVKEQMRAMCCMLLYRAIPNAMVIHLFQFLLLWLNIFPPRGGVSYRYSPRDIVVGNRLDYHKHCRVPFVSYVQVNDVPSELNSRSVSLGWTTNTISLGPTGNQRGGYYFLSLATGRVVTRYSFTLLSVPPPCHLVC